MSCVFRGALAVLVLFAYASGANSSPCERSSGGASQILEGQPLSLDAVIAEVRRTSPSVRAAGLEARALAAEADQAARLLNPSIGLDLENFGGGGDLADFEQAETTLFVAQTIRLGGKRGLGESAARARHALATAECGVILREAELQASLLFAELVAAVRLRDLAEESAGLAEELAMIVQRRVNAGAAAPPELARARTDAAARRAAVTDAEANIERRRYELSSLWGDSEPRFAPPLATTPFLESMETGQDGRHPMMDAANAAVKARAAETEFARSARIPDITLSVGVRHFEFTGDQALVAGISVPLPLNDRGQDAVRASSLREDAAYVNRLATEQRLLAQHSSAIAARRSARARLNILEADALPAADEAYEAAVRGYQIGRFDLTSTVIARAALLNVRLSYIDANRALWAEDLRLRALTGSAPFNGDF